MTIHQNMFPPQTGDIWRYTSFFMYDVHLLVCGDPVAKTDGWNFQAMNLDGGKAGTVEYWRIDYESSGRWEKLA
jgi:hypothetical protein